MINHVFNSLSAVQIYDISYIHSVFFQTVTCRFMNRTSDGFFYPQFSEVGHLSIYFSKEEKNAQRRLTEDSWERIIVSNRLLLVALTYKKLRDVRIDSSPMEPEVYHKLCNSLSFVILNTLGSFIYPLRGCLTKNHPLNLAQKIILLETLATERLYQG